MCLWFVFWLISVGIIWTTSIVVIICVCIATGVCVVGGASSTVIISIRARSWTSIFVSIIGGVCGISKLEVTTDCATNEVIVASILYIWPSKALLPILGLTEIIFWIILHLQYKVGTAALTFKQSKYLIRLSGKEDVSAFDWRTRIQIVGFNIISYNKFNFGVN